MAQSIPRQDYPRPQFVRNEWLNLNGMWEFEIDNSKSGRERGLSQAPHLSGKILVPFCPESSLSGVKNTDFMDAVWYKRRFLVPGKWGADKRRIFLHIGACDYMTEVWVNGKPAGRHEGGYSPISLEITDLVMQGEENVVTICASDANRAMAIFQAVACTPVQPEYGRRFGWKACRLLILPEFSARLAWKGRALWSRLTAGKQTAKSLRF